MEEVVEVAVEVVEEEEQVFVAGLALAGIRGATDRERGWGGQDSVIVNWGSECVDAEKRDRWGKGEEGSDGAGQACSSSSWSVLSSSGLMKWEGTDYVKINQAPCQEICHDSREEK